MKLLPFSRPIPKLPVQSLEAIFAQKTQPPQQFTLEAIAPAKPATRKDGIAAIEKLGAFIHSRQIKAVRNFMSGEEGQFFIDKMIELAAQVAAMPATYGQDGLGEQAIAHLHYFVGGCDWWITEKDKGYQGAFPGDPAADGPGDHQRQAFGYADLGDPGCAELGYISLPEILNAGAELDFYFAPTSLAEIKAR